MNRILSEQTGEWMKAFEHNMRVIAHTPVEAIDEEDVKQIANTLAMVVGVLHGVLKHLDAKQQAAAKETSTP